MSETPDYKESLLHRAEVVLPFLSVSLLMSKAWDSTLQAMDSSIHARLALEVTRPGSWLPKLPMPELFLDSGRPYFNDHPFTLFYLVGQFMRHFGAEAWSARFLPSLFAVGCVWLTCILSRKLFNEKTAWLSGTMLLFTPLFIQFSARFQLDPPMVFFILLSFFLWARGRVGWAGLAAGLAVIFKSPVGFLLLPSALLTHLVFRRRFTVPDFLQFAKATAAALLPPLLLWLIADRISGQPLFSDYLHHQVLGTAVSGRSVGQTLEPFYFVGTVLRSNRIWWAWLLLAGAGYSISKYRRPINEKAALFLMGALIEIVVISCMRFKFPHYYLPAFPLLAVFLAYEAQSIAGFAEVFLRKLLQMAAIVVPLVLLVFPIHVAPELFPAIRKFTSFIQSEGTCNDVVLFINHKQPYGSAGDYYVELIFYSGRKYSVANCEEAAAKIEGLKPRWILTSGDQAPECLNPGILKLYPFVLKAGNQYLLGSVRSDAAYTDLTPLYRELKAPVDCTPAPLPQDISYRY